MDHCPDADFTLLYSYMCCGKIVPGIQYEVKLHRTHQKWERSTTRVFWQRVKLYETKTSGLVWRRGGGEKNRGTERSHLIWRVSETRLVLQRVPKMLRQGTLFVAVISAVFKLIPACLCSSSLDLLQSWASHFPFTLRVSYWNYS